MTYGFNEEADIIANNENIFYVHRNLENKSIVNDIDGILEILFQKELVSILMLKVQSFPVIIEGVFGKIIFTFALSSLSVAHALDLNMLILFRLLKL